MLLPEILQALLGSAHFDLVSHARFYPEPFLTHSHGHEHLYQLSYLVAGACSIQVEERSFLMRPGDLLFVPPGQLHGPAWNLLNDRSEVLHVKFEIDRSLCWSWPTVFPVDSRLEYQTVFESLVAEATMHRPLRDEMLRTHLVHLVLILARSLSNRRDTGSARPERFSIRNELKVRAAMEWIREHYAEPLRLHDLARTVGMSASALSHSFRAMTGEAPMRYLAHYRLSRALFLMERTDEKLEAIADKVGFYSAAYLSRQFVLRFGLPPRQYIIATSAIPPHANSPTEVGATPLRSSPATARPRASIRKIM